MVFRQGNRVRNEAWQAMVQLNTQGGQDQGAHVCLSIGAVLELPVGKCKMEAGFIT